jgi:hypothetical protein
LAAAAKVQRCERGDVDAVRCGSLREHNVIDVAPELEKELHPCGGAAHLQRWKTGCQLPEQQVATASVDATCHGDVPLVLAR